MAATRAMVAWGLGLVLLAVPAAASPVTMRVEGTDIRLTAHYGGADTKVTLRVCEGCDAAVRLSSPRTDVRFPLKGKRGPFWLTVGGVSFHNVPWLYEVKTTAPVERILSPAECVRYALDEPALEASIHVQAGVDNRLYLAELVKLKKAEGTFGFDAGGLRRSEGGGLEAVFRWPARTPTGRYTIEAFAIRDGRVIGRASRVVSVRKAGLAAWISSMATGHGVIYGFIAVIIAMLTGLAASLVFSRVPRGKRRPPGRTGSSS